MPQWIGRLGCKTLSRTNAHREKARNVPSGSNARLSPEAKVLVLLWPDVVMAHLEHVMALPFVPDDSSTGGQKCSEMRAAISRGAASMPPLLAGTCHRRPDFIMDRPEISRLADDGCHGLAPWRLTFAATTGVPPRNICSRFTRDGFAVADETGIGGGVVCVATNVNIPRASRGHSQNAKENLGNWKGRWAPTVGALPARTDHVIVVDFPIWLVSDVNTVREMSERNGASHRWRIGCNTGG
jgi:hypothetical protein